FLVRDLYYDANANVVCMLHIKGVVKKLNFAMRKSPYLLVSPTLALRSSLERIVTNSGRGFDDWQCRLVTLPFTFFEGGREFSVCSAAAISAGKKVDIGLGGWGGKLLRPTDMSLYSCDVRIDVSVDLTRSSP
nr:hypothetical protein [Tanacetum cinerariifolium]